MTNEDLRQIAELMDAKLEPLKEEMAEIKENTEATRDATNRLIEWAENVSNAIRFPLPKL